MFARPRPKQPLLPPAGKKRKASAAAIDEIAYDQAARLDYLTGFHRRKQARIRHAQGLAERRARQDRIESRKKACRFCPRRVEWGPATEGMKGHACSSRAP